MADPLVLEYFQMVELMVHCRLPLLSPLCDFYHFPLLQMDTKETNDI